MYKVNPSTSERWIYISCDNMDEPEGFVALVKEYNSNLAGTIKAYSKNGQYIIDKDPLKLIFQWDDCFGITVVVPTKTDIRLAEQTLIGLCEKLNRNI